MSINYSGIGSRETPDTILTIFTRVAKYLATQDCILRSGGADGADLAFEHGCDLVPGTKEIYIPWRGFNNSTSTLVVSDPKAFELAAKYHPAYHRLSQGAQKLMARNCHQVLGLTLESPADFIICYTRGGTGAGGTGQALRIAKDYNIPVFDAGAYYPQQVELALLKFIIKFIP